MADFYDPTSDVQTEWDTTGGNHYGEIDDATRNPGQPGLADYVSTNSNGDIDEWGFPAVTGSPPEICAWLYVETGSNATIEVSFQQGGVERASLTVPVSTGKGWVHCVWLNPTGDLSTLTIEVTQVKSGGGAGTYAYVYAAYLRAGPNLDKQVGASGDDGSVWGGTLYVTEAYLHHGFDLDYSGSVHSFYRWLGVTIEGTIDTSYIEVYGYQTDADVLLKVSGVDEDNPAAPTSAAEFGADPLTTADIDWDGVWTLNDWGQSPSLNTIFQELVDSYTISNDAVMVQVKDDSTPFGYNLNSCRSWDYTGNAHGPKLHIEYTEAAVGQPMPVRAFGIPTRAGLMMGGRR